MPPPFLNPLLARVLNALLAREDWARARLRPHAGKTVRLRVADLDLTLAIEASGAVAERAPGAQPASVSVAVAAADLPRLLRADPHERMQVVRIEGEAALAHAVGDLARDLRWDPEDDLGRLIGDLPAAVLSRLMRGGLAAVREGGLRLAQNAAEYTTHEAGLLATREAVAGWAAEVAEFDAATQSLAERVNALERSRNRHP